MQPFNTFDTLPLKHTCPRWGEHTLFSSRRYLLHRHSAQTHTCFPFLQTCDPNSLGITKIKCGSLIVAPYLAPLSDFPLDLRPSYCRGAVSQLTFRSMAGLTGQASLLQFTSCISTCPFPVSHFWPSSPPHIPAVARSLTSYRDKARIYDQTF